MPRILAALGVAAAGALGLASLLTPNAAHACGGTFCDGGPGPVQMPVDQTGENILFVYGPDWVEAHIQVQYDPDTPAEKFAWVIPVLALPEFSVGSDPLFDNLLAATVPIYGFSTTFQNCGGLDAGGDAADGIGDAGDGDGDADSDADSDGPDPIFQGTVGAYSIAVLEGGTVESLMQWLADNGYQQDMAAAPILEEYLEEGFLFVALRLNTGAGVDEIHPITLRIPGNEACVPIRLTRIAAVDDMEIRTFFLGQARAVPTTYRHVLVNPLKIDWLNLGANYQEVVSMAVDAEGADGNAFVTEFAGSSSVVSGAGVYSAQWDAGAFESLGTTPELTVDTLAEQLLMWCDPLEEICEYYHPLVGPLLADFLPVPQGLSADVFYSCLSCYVDQIDLQVWDAAAFASAMDERIVQPGLRASALLTENPYLTRMYTRISPWEMIADPLFTENPELPTVDNLRMGVMTFGCSGDFFTLPDGRVVALPDSTVWPEFPEELPWEEAVEQGQALGPWQTLNSQTEVIDAAICDWNRSAGQGRVWSKCGDQRGCACAAGGSSPDPTEGLGLLALVSALGLGGRVRRRHTR